MYLIKLLIVHSAQSKAVTYCTIQLHLHQSTRRTAIYGKQANFECSIIHQLQEIQLQHNPLTGSGSGTLCRQSHSITFLDDPLSLVNMKQ